MTEIEKVEKIIMENEDLTEEHKFMLRVISAVKEFIGKPVRMAEVQEIELELGDNPSLYKSIMKSLEN